jgi:hypothetical protein
MKAKSLIKYLAPVFAFVVIFQQGCKDDDDSSEPEFVATSDSFANFRSWTNLGTNQGPSPSLGMAHQGNDENATRTIYLKDNADRKADGEFPVGTILVKETKDEEGNTIEVTAMVKRGSEFNPNTNDWEWFMLMPDGTIAPALDENGDVMEDASGNPILARSENITMFTAMCGGCHAQASNDDYVFSK